MHSSLALAASGRVYAWGWNVYGQLGLVDTVDGRAPAPIRGLEPARAIAAGETHAAALCGDALFGWGNNAASQIGQAKLRQSRPRPLFTSG